MKITFKELQNKDKISNDELKELLIIILNKLDK